MRVKFFVKYYGDLVLGVFLGVFWKNIWFILRKPKISLFQLGRGANYVWFGVFLGGF
jgi:hypothetical protein